MMNSTRRRYGRTKDSRLSDSIYIFFTERYALRTNSNGVRSKSHLFLTPYNFVHHWTPVSVGTILDHDDTTVVDRTVSVASSEVVVKVCTSVLMT